jgi:hypothetical protein
MKGNQMKLPYLLCLDTYLNYVKKYGNFIIKNLKDFSFEFYWLLPKKLWNLQYLKNNCNNRKFCVKKKGCFAIALLFIALGSKLGNNFTSMLDGLRCTHTLQNLQNGWMFVF